MNAGKHRFSLIIFWEKCKKEEIMPEFDEDYEASTSLKPQGMWRKPELEETPSMKAVLRGFDAIGQPYPDPPAWHGKTPGMEMPDFNTSGYQMPKPPDTDDIFGWGNKGFMGQSGGANPRDDFFPRPEHKPYSANFNPDAAQSRLPNALGANWNGGDTNREAADPIADLLAISNGMGSARKEREKQYQKPISTVEVSPPQANVQANPGTHVPVRQVQTNPEQGETTRYSPHIDHEFMGNAEAYGVGNVFGGMSDGAAGAIRNYGSRAIGLMHGDHAGKLLERVYNEDPFLYSHDSAAARVINDNTILEFISRTRQAEVDDVWENADHLYQGLNIKKDEFTLGLKEFKLFTDGLMQQVDPHFVADRNLPGEIGQLRQRISAGKQADSAQQNRDLGDTIRSIRKGFYKDFLGQKMVDAGIFLATRQVSVGAEAFYQLIRTMSTIHADDTLQHGEGSLLRAAGMGADSAARTGMFNKSMQIMSRQLSGPHKLMFDYLVGNLSDNMKEAVIQRANRPDDPNNRKTQ